MCGIAGLIGRIDSPNRAAVQRMTDALAHRGPDGEGLWESPADHEGRGVILGHRRLSILDLSNAASQPMIDAGSGNALVLNGEIYNYLELREQLLAAGHTFQSTGDTAVMLRLLCVDGSSAVRKLRGMFAFALWYREERSLLLARDPLGIKPLYIARNNEPHASWYVAFASEIRSLIASGLLGSPQLDAAATASMLWNGFMVAPRTAVAQIQSMMPGELLSFDGSGKERHRERYWSLQPVGASPPASVEEVGEVLQRCVTMHLASDVPLGVFLSGGIDSSVVANLAKKAGKGDVNSFTLTFDEAEFSEGAIARQVAHEIGTRHHESTLTESAFIARLDAALDSLDQPTFDALNSYYMSHAVRAAGFKVALVGSGGDELFGGYRTFKDIPRLMTLARCMRRLPRRLRFALGRVVAAVGQAPADGFPGQTRWAKLPDMLARGADLLALYQLAYSLFLPDTQRSLLGGRLGEALLDGLPMLTAQALEAEVDSRQVLPALSCLEQRLFLGERLLRDTDAVSMSASLEVRLPLVDQVLVESVYRLPTRTRFFPQGKKAVLRQIGLKGLNPATFQRPKSGFVLPYDRWLRNRLGNTIDGTMRDSELIRPTGLDPEAVRRLWQAYLRGAPGLYWSRVWAVYVFIRWCHRYGIRL